MEQEMRELRQRLERAETHISQLEGRFEFISGQLRDVQLFMHARFEDIDKRFDQVDRRFEQMDQRFEQVDKRFEQVDKRFEQVDKRLDNIEAKVDALPRVLAEMIAEMIAKRA